MLVIFLQDRGNPQLGAAILRQQNKSAMPNVWHSTFVLPENSLPKNSLFRISINNSPSRVAQ
jgi:hypothetical protein